MAFWLVGSSKRPMGSGHESKMSGDGVGFVADCVGVGLRRVGVELRRVGVELRRRFLCARRRPVVALAVDVDAVDVLDVILSTSASGSIGKNGVELLNLFRPGGMKRVFVSVTGGPSTSINHF